MGHRDGPPPPDPRDDTGRNISDGSMPLALVLTALLIIAGGAVITIAAQSDGARDALRSLLFLNGRRTWLLTTSVPDDYRFCAEQDAIGRLRGCVTAKELRDKAATERRGGP